MGTSTTIGVLGEALNHSPRIVEVLPPPIRFGVLRDIPEVSSDQVVRALVFFLIALKIRWIKPISPGIFINITSVKLRGISVGSSGSPSSKLKQTEIECEYLRRCFGSLTEQNRRLLREVEELRALKVGPPTDPLPTSNSLTMCPRCERVTSNPSSNNIAPATVKGTTKPAVPAQVISGAAC